MSQFTIILDVDLSKPKARAITVSGARPGELPVIRTGAFAERHAMADAIYGQLVAKKPRATLKKSKAKSKAKATPTADAAIEVEPAEELTAEDPEEKIGGGSAPSNESD